ncbi:MAG: NAD-dependent dehydratase [Candidatus Levybacteria bacterium RIFCSPLOWO2_01_FULL_36_13]|nr:MAG: NAD-dependent dehydratase [Candidatus Levybacteria bacterium RIFCSPHIGHO2_01_FULL_36_15b]OGH35859.1 MAG: NAD-dependent dehydratase [Candidatus Levybacteria bacterium RIFCSPLOWO2_01_FULL_36_13]
METCLVAGGGGFIGSHLCKSLLDENFKVICVDNFITGDKANINSLTSNSNFKLLEKDIIKEKDFEAEKIDYIFHLASPASPNAKSKKSYINFPLETLLVNSVGTYNLLELSLKNNSKFLYTSTSEVYGDPAVSPQNEEYFGNVNPNGIRSPYDESKRFGEAITQTYFRKFNLDTRIIRIFNTYGPNMQKDDGRVVSNFINQAIEGKSITIYGDGSQSRSFCYVTDMIEGIKKSMFSERSKGEVINLGNPNERSILDFAKLIIKLTGSASEIVFENLPEDDPKKRRPDITKAKSLLDWEPKVGLEDGINNTIEYYKSL